MTRNELVVIVVVAAVSLSMGACSSSPSESTTDGGPTPSDTAVVDGSPLFDGDRARDGADADPTDSRADGDAPSSPSVPTHVLTWDYVGGSLGWAPDAKPPIAIAEGAKWQSWGDVARHWVSQTHAAGMKSYFYEEIDVVYSLDTIWPSLVESDFAHDCAGSRLAIPGYSPPLDLTDPHSTHLHSAWKTWVDAALGADAPYYDVVFADGADAVWKAHTPAAMPCGYAESDWNTAHVKLFESLGKPVMFNGLWPTDVSGAISAPHTLPLLDGANVVGAREEGCYIQPYQPSVNQKIFGAYWQQDLDTEIYLAAKKKLLLCMSGWNAPTLDGAKATDQRIYSVASFFLAYDLDTSILGMGFRTPSKFHVEPESTLVPMHPLTPTPTSSKDLLMGGVFVREYADCYVAGKRIGGCAIVVNSDHVIGGTASHPFPKLSKTYTHTLELVGAGILDGGTMRTDGPAPPTTLPEVTAVIAFE